MLQNTHYHLLQWSLILNMKFKTTLNITFAVLQNVISYLGCCNDLVLEVVCNQWWENLIRLQNIYMVYIFMNIILSKLILHT